MKTTILGSAALVATALLAAGCGGGNSSQAAASDPATGPASSATPSKPVHTRDPYAPNTGKYALRVGEPRRGKEITSTLLAVKRPMVSAAEPYLKPDEPSQEFLGAEVRTCVKKNSRDRDQIVWADWEAQAPNGNVFPGWDSNWDQWPTPQYPSYKVLSPGECVQGWLLIPVPKGSHINKVAFVPAGGPTVAEWHVRS